MSCCYLKDIYISTRRMSELISTLLSISRIELGTLTMEEKKINILEFTSKILDEFEIQLKNKKISLKRIYGDVPFLEADPSILRIVIQNLVSNAIRYTPEEGNITVEIRPEGRKIILKISDTGCGIPRREQHKIFSKLFRADNAREISADGFGLGLYIVRSILRKMNGRIWFRSPVFFNGKKEVGGTAFYVSLPVKKKG